MPDHGPFLKLGPISLEEKWKTKIGGNCAVWPARLKKHRAIRWVVVRLHFYWTIASGGLGTSEVEHRSNLGIDHTHHRLNVFDPFLHGCPALWTESLGRLYVKTPLVRMLITLVAREWFCIVPLIRTVQEEFEGTYCFGLFRFAT